MLGDTNIRPTASRWPAVLALLAAGLMAASIWLRGACESEQRERGVTGYRIPADWLDGIRESDRVLFGVASSNARSYQPMSGDVSVLPVGGEHLDAIQANQSVGRAVFSYGFAVYVLTLGGVTSDFTWAEGFREPTLSADGTEIAWVKQMDDGEDQLQVVCTADVIGAAPPVSQAGLTRTAIDCAAFAPTGRLVAFGSGGRVWVWEVGARVHPADAPGDRDARPRRGAPPVDGLAWSSDGERIAFTRAGRLWEMRVGDGSEQAITADGTPVLVGTPMYSPDGTRIACAAEHGGLVVTRPSDARGTDSEAVTQYDTGRATGLAWSPDGRYIVYSDGALRMMRLSDGASVTAVEGPDSAFNPNGTVVGAVTWLAAVDE